MNTFSNSIVIKSKLSQVSQLLTAVNKISKWDLEVTAIEKVSDKGYKVIRKGPAINPTENLIISTIDDHIIYSSTNGVVEYQINFGLTENDETTTLVENVTISKIPETGVNLNALLSIAKQAFMEKLKNFQALVENQPFDSDTNVAHEEFANFTKHRETLKETDTKLFDNRVQIASTIETAKKVLADPQRLIEWDNDIKAIDQTDTGINITRKHPAINEFETINISTKDDTVSYASQGGLVEYRVAFSLEKRSDTAITLHEVVFLTGYPDMPIPFDVFQPVTKHAFMEILVVLKTVIKSEQLKDGVK